MSALVADTHAILWYFFASSQLSVTARSAMDQTLQRGDPIFVATISLVEVAYLVEKGRVPAVSFERLYQLLFDTSSRFVAIDLDPRVASVLCDVPRALIPDMPDRIITATARYLNCPLVTADRQIQASRSAVTIW